MKYKTFICFKQKNVQKVSTLYAETNQLLVKTDIKVLFASLRVRTHQQSRVESNPVQSDSCGSDSVAYLQWPLRQ